MDNYYFGDEDMKLLLNSPSASSTNGLEISPLMLTPPQTQAMGGDTEVEVIETEVDAIEREPDVEVSETDVEVSETDVEVSETESEYEPLRYVIREIKAMREVRGQLQLLVQYEPSYEPFHMIAEDVPDMVRDFLDNTVEKRNNKKARAMAVEYFLNH